MVATQEDGLDHLAGVLGIEREWGAIHVLAHEVEVVVP